MQNSTKPRANKCYPICSASNWHHTTSHTTRGLILFIHSTVMQPSDNQWRKPTSELSEKQTGTSLRKSRSSIKFWSPWKSHRSLYVVCLTERNAKIKHSASSPSESGGQVIMAPGVVSCNSCPWWAESSCPLNFFSNHHRRGWWWEWSEDDVLKKKALTFLCEIYLMWFLT